MSRGTNIFILTLLGLGALVGTIMLVRRTRAEAAGTDSNGQPAGTGGGTGISWTNTGTVSKGDNKALQMNLLLSKGSGYLTNNAEVKELQRILNAVQADNPLVIDGMFGPKTQAKLYSLTGLNEISLAAAKIKWPWA